MVRHVISRIIPIDKVKESFQILPSSSRKRLFIVTITQAFLSVLDLIALLLVGSLGSLAVTGIQSASPSSGAAKIIDILGIQDQKLQSQVAIIGFLTAALLVTKTLSSAYLNYKVFFFMSAVSAQISSTLLSKYVTFTFLDIKKRGSQETLFALTHGVSAISNGIVGNFVNLAGDSILLIIMLIGITSIDFKVGLFTVLFFGITALSTHRYASRASVNIATSLVKENIGSNNLVLIILRTFRELSARGLLGFFAVKIRHVRFRISRLEAQQAFIPFVTKYVMELTLIVGGLILSGIQFATQEAAGAVSSIAVFVLASSRISPAILRLQQSVLQVKAAVAGSSITFHLLHELRNRSAISEELMVFQTNHKKFNPVIQFDRVDFSYPNSKKQIFQDFSIRIRKGEIVSIVGPSGSGKTSFADLVLGQLEPDSGSVLVSGLHPKEAQRLYPGAIAYVPQEIYLFEGSIIENILLGLDTVHVKENLIWDALRLAEIKDWVKSLEQGFDYQVKENGSNISGGQRQRIGLARALLTRPKLLILDEATSSLDKITEIEVAKTISNLKGRATVISIAHRPAMINMSSRVIDISQVKISKAKRLR